jgi:transcriptional regulator with XRE-family HTH domain
MARIADHPLRIARLRANISQESLAKRAGVQRSAISAIEDGRTKRPTERLIAAIAPLVSMSAAELEQEIQAWLNKPIDTPLKPSAQNLMLIPPYTLSQYYKTFTDWRREVAPTQTAFASMLRINPATIRDYENGKLQSLPDSLARQMLKAFEQYGFGPEYLAALEGLPRS